MTTTCSCGKPTRDNAYVCDDCLAELSKALGDVPWLAEELEVSITRQRGAAITGGPRSTEHGLPWQEHASDAERGLRHALVTWVRWCEDERVRHSSPNPDSPADTLAAMSRWLMWRVDGLAFTDLGGEAVEAIVSAVAEAGRVVFWKRRQRTYLGPCEARQVDEHGIPGEPCPGDVYADSEAEFGACEDCGFPYKVDQRRADLEQRLDDRLCTAAEVARMAVFLGLEVPRDRVRQTVNVWAKRKRIVARGESGDGPLFKYGEVRSLLAAAYGTREETA